MKEVISKSTGHSLNLLNRFFCSQSTIDYSNSQLPDINTLTNSTLEGLIITEQDVKDAVSCIDLSKLAVKKDDKGAAKTSTPSRISLGLTRSK